MQQPPSLWFETLHPALIHYSGNKRPITSHIHVHIHMGGDDMSCFVIPDVWLHLDKVYSVNGGLHDKLENVPTVLHSNVSTLEVCKLPLPQLCRIYKSSQMARVCSTMW